MAGVKKTDLSVINMAGVNDTTVSDEYERRKQHTYVINTACVNTAPVQAIFMCKPCTCVIRMAKLK